jgi:hypothetical protein
MFIVIVAIIVLVAAVASIYLLLQSMGQDGMEIAAPGSCKRGKCGVQSKSCAGGGDQLEEEPFVQIDEIPADGHSVPER